MGERGQEDEKKVFFNYKCVAFYDSIMIWKN
jgi:hypothetical protein